VQSNATKSATLPLPAARPLAVHSRNGPQSDKASKWGARSQDVRAEFRRPEALARISCPELTFILTSSPYHSLHHFAFIAHQPFWLVSLLWPIPLRLLSCKFQSLHFASLPFGSPGRHPTAVPLSTPALLQQSPPFQQDHRKVDDNNVCRFWRFKRSWLYFHLDVEIVILH
jgi:hypothetical protein